MLKYFAEAEHHQHFGTDLGTCEACGTTRPEFIFDVLETPLRDLSGDIILRRTTAVSSCRPAGIPRITGVINTRLIG